MFNREDRNLADGDRIQWRLANNDLHLKNAERGTVESLEGTLATVRWDRDGSLQKIDLSHDKTWDHGYAETVYSAQSKTYDRVYVLAPVNSGLVNGQNYYTAITRAQFGVKLWTEDPERLVARGFHPFDDSRKAPSYCARTYAFLLGKRTARDHTVYSSARPPGLLNHAAHSNKSVFGRIHTNRS